MMKNSKRTDANYVRNFIFGVEDSLVSTVGMVSGIAVAGVPRETIFLSGMVLIVVEALSMGVGSVLSETATQEFIYKRPKAIEFSKVGGVIMFFSYFIAGFIPLLPYTFFEITRAFPISIFASFIALFALGFFSARRFKAPVFKSALRMFVLGGLAITAGILVGMLIR
ncbi:MAG: VIT1/CCC1 transporter family protein [bacterium]|nr:VIT1/CCC1 transporter family protein [bacterium]